MGDFVHGDQADLKIAHEKHLQQNEKDVEVGSPPSAETETVTAHSSEPEIVVARTLKHRGILATLTHAEEWLDAKMGIETQGVDRIHEEDKKPPSMMNIFWMWWSMTCHIGTVPLGVLGPEFGLSLHQSVSALVVGTILGALCTSYTGTLGPKVCVLFLKLLLPVSVSILGVFGRWFWRRRVAHRP